MACDDEIPSLMLISLIAKGFQPDISEKVLDKDPQTFEDLFKFAKRAESTVKIRKNDSLIASIEGMGDRLMTKLSKTTGIDRYGFRPPRPICSCRSA